MDKVIVRTEEGMVFLLYSRRYVYYTSTLAFRELTLELNKRLGQTKAR